MEIRSEYRKMLVFNAYRHYELAEVGSRLKIGELEDRWLLSGIRRYDLDSTLAELVKNGELQAEMTHRGMVYHLTEVGVRYMQDNPETPAIRRALYQIARRPRSGNGLRLDRRRSLKPFR